MTTSSIDQVSSDRATHHSPATFRWALATTLVCFPMIWIGGLVTTHDAGMAVPDWPGTYGYNLWLYPWTTWLIGPFDLLIEHGHRLLGTVVGLLSIATVLSAFAWDRRSWYLKVSAAILLGVIAQGLLGGVRVLLDARTFAMIHGCTAPLLFGAMACATYMASRSWKNVALNFAPDQQSPVRGSVPWVLYVLPCAAFCQLVVGAQLRHIQPWASPTVFMAWLHTHLTLAGVVTLLIGWVFLKSRGERLRGIAGIPTLSGLLVWLVVFQLSLGLGTWICNYALPWVEVTPWLAKYTIQAKGMWESWIITSHQATGSLIVALSSLIPLYALRSVYVKRGN